MPEKSGDPDTPLVTPQKLVQTFADRHGVDPSKLRLPETGILVPVYPLYRTLARALEGEPGTAWKWKFPPPAVFKTGSREGVIACCPMGAPNVAVALEELTAFGVRTLYFLGFAGGIGGRLRPGSLILPPYAHVGEGTSRYYTGTPLTLADKELLSDLKQGMEKETGKPVHTCPLWTTDALYRETQRDVEEFARQGVCGVDMEVSAVFGVAGALAVRAAAMIWVSDLLSPEGWEPHFCEDTLREAIDRDVMAFAAFLQREG